MCKLSISSLRQNAQVTAFIAEVLNYVFVNGIQAGETFCGVPGHDRYRTSTVVFTVVQNAPDCITISYADKYNGGAKKTISVNPQEHIAHQKGATRTTTTTTTTTKNETIMSTTPTTAPIAAAGANETTNILNALIEQQCAARIEAARTEAAAAYQTQIDALKLENEQLKTTPSGTVINVTINGKTQTTHTDKVLPECFSNMLELLKGGENIFLYGPAGAGKNVLAEELANALDAKFFYYNTLITKFDLTGYCDGHGKYIPTPLYQAVKHAQEGGESVVLLDEICTAAPEALVCINAALANGYFTFADSTEQVSLDRVHFIAADNTNGQGATDEYNGRFKMDESTRDRFFFQELTYQDSVEKSICGENTDIYDFLRDVRRAAKENNIPLLCGYRGMTKFTKFAHWAPEKLIKGFLLRGMETDSARIIYGALKDKENRFAAALGEIVNAD
jgi:hypothetical protein